MSATDERDELVNLRALRRKYERAEAAYEAAKEALGKGIADAINAGARVTDVEKLSPFTQRYTRTIARKYGAESRRPPAE